MNVSELTTAQLQILIAEMCKRVSGHESEPQFIIEWVEQIAVLTAVLKTRLNTH